MTVEIREVVPGDGPALLRAIKAIDAETEFLGEAHAKPGWAEDPEGRIRSFLERGTGIYMLAVRDGEIIGYLGAFPGGVERTRGVVFIPHVGIREAYRGQRIGQRLFEAIERWARGRGAHRMELRVAEANARGRALYTRCGFREEGRLQDTSRRHGKWCNDYWMGRALSDDAPPRWGPVETPRPSPPPGPGSLQLRVPTPEDAPLIDTWERALLTGSMIHLKRPSEVAAVSDVAAWLEKEAADPLRFRRMAVVGAADDQRVVGFLNAWIEAGFRSEHDGHFALNVLPSHAGVGIGRQLLGAFEAWARERGLHRLSTSTQAHNARGLRFAKAQGFAREAVAPNYAVIEGRSVDRVTLGKVLAGT